jgi:acyl-coenzyme A thioesterase PaaI-like protein
MRAFFLPTSGSVIMILRFGPQCRNFSGSSQGGAIASALDVLMCFSALLETDHRPIVTARFEIDYRRGIPLGKFVVGVSQVMRSVSNGPKIWVKATLLNDLPRVLHAQPTPDEVAASAATAAGAASTVYVASKALMFKKRATSPGSNASLRYSEQFGLLKKSLL